MFRKAILGLVSLASMHVVHAQIPEKIDVLSTKVVLENGNGYFVFQDGSCWKVTGFSKRWRSISEWWNNIELAPKNYDSSPNYWELGTEVTVYAKYEYLNADEHNASNQDELKRCNYLLVNSHTQEVLFATVLHPADCMLQIAQAVKKEGYDKGYYEGLRKGRKERDHESLNAFDQGHREGYDVGYEKGYEKGYRKGYTDCQKGKTTGGSHQSHSQRAGSGGVSASFPKTGTSEASY